MCYSLWYNAPMMLPAGGQQHRACECVCVCVWARACNKYIYIYIYINILAEPYSSTTSVATQWLDMQLLVIAGPLGLMELFTQSPNVSNETLHRTECPDKRQHLCVESLSTPHESSLIQSIKQHSIIFQKITAYPHPVSQFLMIQWP